MILKSHKGCSLLRHQAVSGATTGEAVSQHFAPIGSKKNLIPILGVTKIGIIEFFYRY